MKLSTNDEVIKYINDLKDYEGYIQYSNRPIEKVDIFEGFQEITTAAPENGFVLEAHFFNGTDSISIRQINAHWYIDETTNISMEDTESFFAKKNSGLQKVKMAQIWEPEPDPLSEEMEVLQLKKVVFAGFTQGGDK